MKNISPILHLVLIAGAGLAASARADTISYQVSLNTAAYSGTAVDLAFDLIDGGPPSNSVTIGGFSSDGTLGTAPAPSTGVSGNLPSLVTLTDSVFFVELLQPVTAANEISFLLTLTDNPPDITSSPDSFVFSIIDPNTGLPLFDTSDPSGASSLFAVDMDGSAAGAVSIFNADDGSPTAALTAGQPLSSVPEPSSAGLLVVFLVALWIASRRRFRFLAVLFLAAIAAVPASYAQLPKTFTATPDSVTTGEDAAVTFNPLDNDSPDLLPSSVKVISPPQHGTATVDPSSGLITFKPAEHFSGKDQMAYQACNGSGSCTEAFVTLRISPFGNYRIVAGFSEIFDDTPSATYIMNPDGSGIQPQPIARGMASISPDGARVASVEGDTVIVQPIDSSSLLSVIRCQAPGQILSAASWSPDGTQLTFTAPSTDEKYDGQYVLYTVQPPDSVLSECKPAEIVGGASSAPIRGLNPNWGIGGIAFDSYFTFDPSTPHPGISIISPGGDPMPYSAIPFSSHPAWAPDGSAIAYLVNSPGGNAIFIGDKPILSGMPQLESVAWSPDGSKLVYAAGGVAGGYLTVVNPDGSNFNVITGAESYYLQHVSWDPRPITPPPSPTSRPMQIAFRQIDRTGEPTSTPTFGGVGRMSASGSGRTLLIQDTLPFLGDGTTQPKWSPDRSKILFSIAHDTQADINDYRFLGFLASALFTMNPDGSIPAPIPNLPPNEDILFPVYSPDGSRIVFSMQRLTTVPPDTGHCLWTSAIDGLNLKQLTPCTSGTVSASEDIYPAWSPDGKYIAYLQAVDVLGGNGSLVVMNADGTNRQAVKDPGITGFVYGAPAWSPDETKLAVGTLYGLRVGSFTPGSGMAPKNFAPVNRFAVLNAVLRPDSLQGGPRVSPTWSPDGQALAYVAPDASGQVAPETITTAGALWVINADGTRETQISSFGESTQIQDPDWGHPDNLSVQDVTASVAITRGGFRYNRLTKQYVQTVTLENISSSPLAAPLSLVLDSLSLSATLVNNNGVTKANPPYNSFYIDVTASPLAPGASASVNLNFTNVGSAPITYGTTVLAGPGQR